jgi:hypothetical protein
VFQKAFLTQGTLRITQRALRINIENQFFAPFALKKKQLLGQPQWLNVSNVWQN